MISKYSIHKITIIVYKNSVFFKILLIGDLGVGKSCVILRYIEDDFPLNIMSSIGVDFKSKQIEIDDRLIKMQIWDTAGHEKFRTITTSYYKSAHAIIILYDITDLSTFEHVKNWMVDIDKFGKQGVLKVIVGNKKDLEDKRQVSEELAKTFAEKNGIKFMEVSAKNNINIEQLFLDIIKSLLEKHIKAINDNPSVSGVSGVNNNNIVLNKKTENKKKKCC